MYNIFSKFLINKILSLSVLFNTYREWYISYARRGNLESNLYIFFEDYSCPFLASSVKINSIYSAKPRFVYNSDTLLFFPYVILNLQDPVKKGTRLPILSLEIIDSTSLVIFDLTDYIEKIRYVDVSCPTISEIIITWTISSGIVLDRNIFKARYIDKDGESNLIEIDNMDSFENSHED